MSAETALRPARRFLHACYNCQRADPVVAFVADGLDLRLTMRTPMEPSSGSIFNMDGEIEAEAAFVFDERGPRSSPAIEIQGWNRPSLFGAPPEDPTAAGIQALGYGVADLDASVDRLTGLGCSVVGRGRGPSGPPTVVVRDPDGVTWDIVRDPDVPAGSSWMRHLRISSTDLDASVPWYEGLGFTEVDRQPLDDGAAYGVEGAGSGVAARLRLPDEPTELLLTQWDEPATHGRHPSEAFHAGLYRVALGVDDTRASYDAMKADGWRFDREPLPVELHETPVPDMWICFLSDPDGVPFELVQRPRSAFRPARSEGDTSSR